MAVLAIIILIIYLSNLGASIISDTIVTLRELPPPPPNPISDAFLALHFGIVSILGNAFKLLIGAVEK